MKKFFMGLGLVALVVMVFFIAADAQSRKVLCNIFDCEKFVNLVGLTTTIQSDVAQLKVDVSNIEAGDYSAELARIEAKVDQMLAPQARIWLQDNSDFGLLPINAGQGEQFDVELWLHGESLMNFLAFGYQVQYPDTNLRLDGINRGEVLSTWQSVDFNVNNPSLATIGGFAGAGQPIVGPAVVHLITMQFTVIGGVQGDQAAICILNYVDDLTEFSPASFCATVNITN